VNLGPGLKKIRNIFNWTNNWMWALLSPSDTQYGYCKTDQCAISSDYYIMHVIFFYVETGRKFLLWNKNKLTRVLQRQPTQIYNNKQSINSRRKTRIICYMSAVLNVLNWLNIAITSSTFSATHYVAKNTV